MIRTFNPDIIRHINTLLEPKPKVEEPIEYKVEPKVEPKVEEPIEYKVESKNRDKFEELRDEESDDEYNKEQVEKYKPNKISFLTLDDEYNTTIVKRDKPVIYGKCLCECGAKYTPSNKSRHERSFRHKCYVANQSSQE